MLWIIIAIYIGVIYSTLPLMRPVLNYLYEVLGDRLLNYFVHGTLAVVVILFIALVLRTANLGYRRAFLIITILVIGTAAAVSFELPEERVHFLEYGALGYLVIMAMSSWRLPLAASLVFVTLVGVGDEAVQWMLPNRVGDLRDVLMNFIGGLIGTSVGRLYVRY